MRTPVIGIVHWVAKHAASSYIAGLEIEDALRVCRQVENHGWTTTICPWDGAQDTAERVASTYKEALDCIKKERLNSYLSIKVPSLKYDFGILREVTDIAREQSIRIHFDSLAPETAARSLAIFEKALDIYPNLSYTLPSCWRRSLSDAKRLISWRVPVRIVKGQWPDPAEPKRDTERGFLKLIDIFGGRASHVAVATHDTSLAMESLTRLRAAGTSCELEQLYGLPNRDESVAKPLSVPVRIYVPYGHAYLAYSLSAMRRRPIILAWLIKDFLRGYGLFIQSLKGRREEDRES